MNHHVSRQKPTAVPLHDLVFALRDGLSLIEMIQITRWDGDDYADTGQSFAVSTNASDAILGKLFLETDTGEAFVLHVARMKNANDPATSSGWSSTDS